VTANTGRHGGTRKISGSVHNFLNAMAPTREDVVRLMRGAFPEPSWNAVSETLDMYGVEPHERERERVQIAVLKLSGTDEGRLLHFVATAKQDYRDVLFWSEHPE
jgi:hypothetical protein